MLRLAVEHKLNELVSKTGISTLEVIRYGEAHEVDWMSLFTWAQQPTVTVHFSPFFLPDGCPESSTFIPSPSGDPNLLIELEWPETDIGQTRTLKCPCGPKNFSIGVM